MRFSAFLLGVIVTAALQSSSVVSLAQDENELENHGALRRSEAAGGDTDRAAVDIATDDKRQLTGEENLLREEEDDVSDAHHHLRRRNETSSGRHRKLEFTCRSPWGSAGPYARQGRWGVKGDCHRDALDQRKSPSGYVELSEHICWGRYKENFLAPVVRHGWHVVFEINDARKKCINIAGSDARDIDNQASSASWQFEDVHCDDVIRFYPDANCQGSYKEWNVAYPFFPSNFVVDGINDQVSSFMIVNRGDDRTEGMQRRVSPKFSHINEGNHLKLYLSEITGQRVYSA